MAAQINGLEPSKSSAETVSGKVTIIKTTATVNNICLIIITPHSVNGIAAALQARGICTVKLVLGLLVPGGLLLGPRTLLCVCFLGLVLPTYTTHQGTGTCTDGCAPSCITGNSAYDQSTQCSV